MEDPPSTEATRLPQETKPVHTLVLDTSPLLLNTPPLSTLLSISSALVTTPSVLAELRTPEARSRVDTLYTPFLTVRTPKPESVKVIRDFARRTGDLAVLSATDLEVIALAYECECERNGGDWRLRRVPGQKGTNGPPPATNGEGNSEVSRTETDEVEEVTEAVEGVMIEDHTAAQPDDDGTGTMTKHVDSSSEQQEETGTDANAEAVRDASEEAQPDETITEAPSEAPSDQQPSDLADVSSDSDSGWITPSNIKRHQAQDSSTTSQTKSAPKHLQVATMTGDFALQNVLLQMNLNLLSPRTTQRITHLKQFILRCHACFATTRNLTKQFCDRCGKPTLTRVSTTTNANGEVKLHLQKNMQWNNKGNVFSIPKPVAGTSNGKWQGNKHGGGGKGGWGNGLILTEDQKEYQRAVGRNQRRKEKDLMDEDFLPGILTGSRGIGGNGRVKVGAGRNVNSRKRQ